MGYGSLKNYETIQKGQRIYINPSDPEQLQSMDMNTVYDTSRISVFPELITSGIPFPKPDYLCSRPRSTKTVYIKDTEVFKHPQHFSRYGYARCFNGYCSGHFPGRYIVNDDCSENDQPYDTAPRRFYSLDSIGQCGR